MKIKPKLILLIASTIIIFAVIFLIAGTAFSIHEVLLVKRYDLKIIARKIDLDMQNYPPANINTFKEKIINGLLFAEKKKYLDVEIFDKEGNWLFGSGETENQAFIKEKFPDKQGKYIESAVWTHWTRWDIDFYYTGMNCHVKMKLLQKLEIQEDLALFFFGSLPIIIILALIAGHIITYQILKRAERIQKAADQIASGNLKYRIPDSPVQDEIKNLEVNLNYAFAELEKSFDNIMEFSADIAHELRTPLTIITGEIDVALRETRTPEEYQIIMVNVLEEIALLRKIIDDMLILVKPESAYKSMPFEPIDISLNVSDIINSYKLLSDSKDIQIITEIQPEIFVNGTKSLLHLIFANLIYNAIKFTSENGEIKIKLIAEDEIYANFSVTDNGRGIPEKELDKIFSRFYRLSQDKNNRGTGLGLSIVKKVCDINNAIIEVQSTEGKGSCFLVKIPLLQKGKSVV